jgi:hypothetical protein
LETSEKFYIHAVVQDLVCEQVAYNIDIVAQLSGELLSATSVFSNHTIFQGFLNYQYILSLHFSFLKMLVPVLHKSICLPATSIITWQVCLCHFLYGIYLEKHGLSMCVTHSQSSARRDHQIVTQATRFLL